MQLKMNTTSAFKKYTVLGLLLLLLTSGAKAQMTPTLDNIWVPMRDGDSLQADVYIPAGLDSAQVILIQTPYNKDLFAYNLPLGTGQNIDNSPYIWVIVDWRGFYGSSGADLSNVNRGEDGYDVCDWIVDQTWHKDRIGTWGPSALGGVQYSTAREQHPNHTCAVPQVAHPQQSYDSYFYGGVLEKARLEQLDALGYGLSPLILANTYYSAIWAYSENTTWYANEIDIPTLQIGGWYDHNIDKMMDWYEACRTNGALPNEQWLLVGPWVHGGTGAAYVGSSIQGELTYPNAEFISDTMALDFFAYYLLDSANNWLSTPKITYYELGADQWQSSNNASIEASGSNILYLNQSNQLTAGTGVLSSGITVDPANPSPTIGGANLHPSLDQGPYDQISLESRNDIEVFETADLPSDVTITGRVKAHLYIECDQPDADISVRLVDVYPDGRNMLIADGIHRMRFRNGFEAADEEFMTPGVIYEVEVVLPFTHYTWQAGHQIKIFVGGNSSYRWDVNLQNGDAMYTAGDTNIAEITIHHSANYGSYLSLPGDNPFLSIEKSNAIDFSIYPNPANDHLMVLSDHDLMKFTIFSMDGKIVSQGNMQSNQIDLKMLEPGFYFIQFTSQKGQSQLKKFCKT